MRKIKMTGRAINLPAGTFLGAVLAFGWTILTSALLAWLVHKEVLKEENIGYGSMAILLSSALLGSMLAYSKVHRQKLWLCICVGIVYYLMLLSLTALFFGGQYTGMGVTGLLILGGCGTAALIETEAENRKGKGRKIRI